MILTKDDSRDRIKDDGTGRSRGTYSKKNAYGISVGEASINSNTQSIWQDNETGLDDME
jgi:hypothetical protein